MKRPYSTVFCLGAALAALSPPAELGAQPRASSLPAAVDFQRDIEPIFHRTCYACHGPSQQMNGLRLDIGEAALKGGRSGAVILPGNSLPNSARRRTVHSSSEERVTSYSRATSSSDRLRVSCSGERRANRRISSE